MSYFSFGIGVKDMSAKATDQSDEKESDNDQQDSDDSNSEDKES